MSPLYNLMKSKQGAEVEPKQNNPYEKQILKDMDQKVDIQPWLNQNMMAMKSGMDFSKDMASGNPMQYFSMYNRLNQGKMNQDSAAWKYKHDTEGNLKSARANFMLNLGEQDRAESARVSDINAQNRAAVDKYVSTAIEQLSAIGQMDEYTANLMQNDALRASFINKIFPDLEKYMKQNPNATESEAVTNTLGQYDEETIKAVLEQIGFENIEFTPVDNQTNNQTGNEINNQVNNQVNNTNDQTDLNNQNEVLDILGGGQIFDDLYNTSNENYNPYPNVDTNDVISDDGAEGDGSNNAPYTPVISVDQMTSLEPMSIQSTGSGKANILENGQPIQVEVDGGTLKVNGVRVDGDKIVVDGAMVVLGQEIPATRDFGEFIFDPYAYDPQDSNSLSGFTWVPNASSWKQFQDNASAEQIAMFENFIAAVEGDARYAQALRDQIDGGTGTLTGAQLNETIRNKPQ